MDLNKIAAGVVCGVASAVPGREVMESYAMATMMAAPGSTDHSGFLSVFAPVALIVMAILLCGLAPTRLSAWLRGTIMIVAISVVSATYVLQCVGMGYLFDRFLDDPVLTREAMATCPPMPSTLMMGLTAAMVVVAGVAAFRIWRRINRADVLEY